MRVSTAAAEGASGARAGLTSFLAGVARTVAASNVTINHILPGSFDTDRIRQVYEARAKDSPLTVEQVAEQDAKAIPLGRLGDPRELANLVAFLASNKATYYISQLDKEVSTAFILYLLRPQTPLLTPIIPGLQLTHSQIFIPEDQITLQKIIQLAKISGPGMVLACLQQRR